jgi:hypothetical protein
MPRTRHRRRGSTPRSTLAPPLGHPFAVSKFGRNAANYAVGPHGTGDANRVERAALHSLAPRRSSTMLNTDKKQAENAATKAKQPIDAKRIVAGMAVMCSKDGQFAVVDHMEGASTIKLNKDDKGASGRPSRRRTEESSEDEN